MNCMNPACEFHIENIKDNNNNSSAMGIAYHFFIGLEAHSMVWNPYMALLK